uniref:ABC transporter domain-containing protein n=1 Tax=Globisporangium ultimum (strain ATCC 200006 / CBS 805.95 / DAOM BR144) TaxID=431595 RepID=K3WSP4_GLOUD
MADNTPTPSTADGSSSTSTATTAALATLTQCVERVVVSDFAYASCVMNSGLFALVQTNSSSNNSSTASELVRALANDADAQTGTCGLMCSKPTIFASSSCCSAVQEMHACQVSSGAPDDIASCKTVLDETFAYQHQCDTLSAENAGLVIATASIAVVFGAVMLLSRRAVRDRTSKNTSTNGPDMETLEARFAAASATRWQAFLASWRQVANLVWKNLLLRRRKPVAFVMEQLLPLLLVCALLILANLDTIFRSGGSRWTTTQAAELNSTILCTDLRSLSATDLGAPTSTLLSFYTSGQSVLGLFFLVSYIKFVSTNTTTMVIEKENRIREVMKIMGLSDFSLLCSWCLTSAILSTPLSFAIAAVLKFGKVFPSTEYATLVFLFWALSLAIVSFSYCITPFFNKSRTAAIVSVLVWLLLFFPFFAVQPEENGPKYWAALCAPTAFALAIDEILRHAQLGMGFSYSIGIVQSPVTVPTASAMSWFLVLDSFIFVLLGWYFEQVLPQQYGVRKPFYFFLQKSYWFGGRSSAANAVAGENGATPHEGGGAYLKFVDSTRFVERQSITLNPLPSRTEALDHVEPVNAVLLVQEQKGTCLQLRGLRKTFTLEDGEEKVAVEGLDLSMYCGQITALLGHNGAGKTTTISMLTGLIEPTAGDATLYGRSIRHNFDELRRIIGICPQHDVLFNDLTVEEHLRLFGIMKNVAPHQLQQDVDNIIEDVGLTETRHVKSKELSGGQKRKLSVAIAFIGDSKLVFLDEPTSGMDPYSRRFTWNLLQKNREDRVIVLTTHFMDEADILGDRIAIVADGKLCCAGSSLFLKNRYGAGYNLTLIKADADCDVVAVGTFLKQFVPGAKCLSNFGSEVVFQLPSASSTAFPQMLEALDSNMGELHILQYGISVTTLEEVFLRISQDRDDASALTDPRNSRIKSRISTRSSTPTGEDDKLIDIAPNGPTFWSQYAALTMKRFQIAKRDKKTLLNSVCIPLLFLIILAVLPTIQVADFIPDYAASLPTQAQQDQCPARNITASLLQGQNLTACLGTAGFSYCEIGVVDCDALACCNAANSVSPFYPCNECVLSQSTPTLAAIAAQTPCFNNQCLKRNDAKLQVTMNSFLISIVVMLGFAFIPASIVAFIVREKDPIQDAKGLQLISGANISAYWLSSWTHDVVVVSISVVAAIIIIPLSSRGLNGSDEATAVAVLVISHVLASIPLAYLFSFRFTKHAVAQTSLLVFMLGTGGLLSIFSFLCRIIDFRISSSFTLSSLDRNYLRWLFLLFPGYSLNNGIYEIASRKVSRRSLYGSGRWLSATSSFFGLFEGLGKEACRECWDRNVNGCCIRGVFDVDVGGAPIIYSVLEAVAFTALVFFLENRKLVWRKKNNRFAPPRAIPVVDEDDDVVAERQWVETTPPTGEKSVFIRNLHHQYERPRGKIALKNLSLAISKGECFGYLGINGAGKSTTMKVLTGQLAPTDGFVMLGPHNLAFDRNAARRMIGYCPQFDSLHDLLTVEEQLALYARLKGIPNSKVADAVDQKIKQVGLSEYRDKLTRGLSGGNKRKVSTAIALIGSPQIVFLDEPSTGVDPSSRRKMWDVIASVCAAKDSCVVLTTHSMEECEALCTRVGIMVSGELKCLGSVEHLKQKFGQGFTVEVKLREPPAEAVKQVHEAIVQAPSPGSTSITKENVASICGSLGIAARGQLILSGEGNGWVVDNFLQSNGSIPVDVFSAWWVAETQSEALQSFFQHEFPGSALVEQQGDHFRFQVPKHTLRPSAIFALLEDAKSHLRVSEYGVSDTSLEHIFNNMAVQQEEERGVVRGMYNQQQHV